MKSSSAAPSIFIAGGINQDIKAASAGHFQPGTSNPGSVWQAPGGVSRNIAHALALLGLEVHLCSLVGDDPAGREILDTTSDAGVHTDTVAVLPGERSGAYISIQNEKGDLVAAVSDMQIMQQFSPEQAERALESLLIDAEAAPKESTASKKSKNQLHSQPSEQIGASRRKSRPGCIVADANIPAETIQSLAQKAEEKGLPFFLEPVSVGKGIQLLGVPFTASWTTPNGDEFRELWRISREDWLKFESHMQFQNVGDPKGESCIALPLEKEALEPLKLDEASKGGIDSDHILVSLGARGLLLLSRDPDILSRDAGQFKTTQDKQAGWRGWWFPPRPVRIKDPNGAGDSFLAGFLAALYHPDLQWPVKKAICFGQAVARCSLESEHTVAPDMNVESVLKALQFSDNQDRQ